APREGSAARCAGAERRARPHPVVVAPATSQALPRAAAPGVARRPAGLPVHLGGDRHADGFHRLDPWPLLGEAAHHPRRAGGLLVDLTPERNDDEAVGHLSFDPKGVLDAGDGAVLTRLARLVESADPVP